jgi:diketogulonate reductase-like aldo/keto reductase
MSEPDQVEPPSSAFSRRRLLQAGGIGAAALGVGGLLASTERKGPLAPRTAADNVIMHTIPKSDVAVPAIGLGTFQTFDVIPQDARRDRLEVLRRFWAAGGRVVDVSPLYGLSEDTIASYAVPANIQNDLFITNKIWSTGAFLWDDSFADASLRSSMQRLSRTVPFDVMQCHSLINVETIVQIMHAWKAEGRIRRLGVTHYDPAYFGPLADWVQTGDLDFVQVRYSMAERRAEDRILPMAADLGVAVMINMPLEKARLHELVGYRPVPDFVADLGIETWAQYFLKWVISHPAVTVALPATANPAHLDDNMRAVLGELPDSAMRTRMLDYVQAIPGFSEVTKRPWYPGKHYPGEVNRAMAEIQSRTSWRPAGNV